MPTDGYTVRFSETVASTDESTRRQNPEDHNRFPRCCVRVQIMEAESTSETSVKFYQTTRHNIPEVSHLNKNLLFYLLLYMGMELGISPQC
jgi:hypothetical protein